MFFQIEPEPWRDRAKCSEVPGDAWFPERDDTRQIREAKALCNACPVRDLCLRHSLDNNEKFGIWGGLTAQERRKMRKQAAA